VSALRARLQYLESAVENSAGELEELLIATIMYKY
jgi:hypothetical protein